MHPGRELRFNMETTFALLSGRDKKGNRIPGFTPQTEWKEVVRLTCTEARPEGIKGNVSLITQNLCRCMKKSKTSQCSCPQCSHPFKTSFRRIMQNNLDTQNRHLNRRARVGRCCCCLTVAPRRPGPTARVPSEASSQEGPTVGAKCPDGFIWCTDDGSRGG